METGTVSARHSWRPSQGVYVKEHGTGGVGTVRDMGGAAREVPDKPGVDRTEEQVPAFSAGPRAGHIVQDPLELRTGKVGVKYETGLIRT
jgi:hypothetical protein